MGHKVNPKIFRIGLSENWTSRWFKRGPLFAQQLEQDTKMRTYLINKLRDCSLKSVEIERSPDNINIILHSSKPGIIIGRGGSGIEEIKKYLQQKIIKNKKIKISINIKEVNKPQLSSQIMAH